MVLLDTNDDSIELLIYIRKLGGEINADFKFKPSVDTDYEKIIHTLRYVANVIEQKAYKGQQAIKPGFFYGHDEASR